MKWRIIFGLFFCGLFVIVATSRRAPHLRRSVKPISHAEPAMFAAGRVEGNSDSVELYASVRESVQSIAVRQGQLVRQGDLLIQLDDRCYAAEVELAEAGVLLAQAEQERLHNGALTSEIDEARRQCEARHADWLLAHRIHQRGLLLAQTQSISQHDLDLNEASLTSAGALFEAAQAKLNTISAPTRSDDLSIADAKLATARARLRIAQAALERTRLCAPRDGVVLQINVEVGELQNEKPMIVLSDTQELYVRASVDEFDALRVYVGQSVRMTTHALPDRDFFGKIARLSPQMDHKEIVSERLDTKMDTRAREIWVELEKDTPLIVGLPMDLWIGEADPAPRSESPPHMAQRKP